jgi:hypothetical protein
MCLWQEIENLVAHLTDHQLDQLEAILAKDLDTDSEFNMLLEGLRILPARFYPNFN